MPWLDRAAGFAAGVLAAGAVVTVADTTPPEPEPPTPPPTITTTSTTSTPGVRFRAPGGGCVETSPDIAAQVGAVDDPACERTGGGEP